MEVNRNKNDVKTKIVVLTFYQCPRNTFSFVKTNAFVENGLRWT